MKIAILNDTHCGVRNSSDIFLNNSADFYDNVFFPYCLENNIKQIVHLGDYYDHRKFINFKALNHNRKHFLNKLRENKMLMDIIPGNHDTFYKNTNDLNSLKELLGYFMNEIHIIMQPTVMSYGNLKLALLPWINAENYEESVNFVKNCKADILGGHLELNGFDLMRGVKNTHGMDHKIFSKFEMVLTGHFHTKSNKDNIHYLGSQLEFTWSDAHDNKYFHVLDTDTRELTPVHNPYTLFEKIYYDDTGTDYNNFDTSVCDNKFVKVIVSNKTDMFTFDRFIDRIQNQKIYELKIAENFSEFIGENVADEEVSLDDTATLLDTYVESVDTDLDKERLKIGMRALLDEAGALEIS
jgi:DNA repair exonuclease SbcCD nuclease subunit